MPSQPTYYTEEEYDAIEAEAERRDESFSMVVREAVREKLDL